MCRMNNGRIKESLAHPAFIALILSAVVILLINPVFSKYRVKDITVKNNNPWTKLIFSDLDNDGNSEKLIFDLNDDLQTKIVVSTLDDRVINQYNLKYHTGYHKFAFIDDINNDGYKECFVFTMSRDSIFLNLIDPVKSHKIVFRNKFVDIYSRHSNSDDAPQVFTVGLIDTGTDTKDFLFFISAGYSLQPRRLYRYSPAHDSIFRSPVSGAVIDHCIFTDISNHPGPVMLLHTSAYGNLEENFPYTDRFSWLMVLNKDLDFAFPPVPFHENPSRLKVLPCMLKEGPGMIVYSFYFGDKDIKPALYLFDAGGNKTKEKILDHHENLHSNIFPGNIDGNPYFFILRPDKSEVVAIDTSLSILKRIPIPEICTGIVAEYGFDADLDGSPEYVIKGDDNKSLIFFQKDFRNPVIWTDEKGPGITPVMSHVLIKGEKPAIYLQSADHGSYIRFEKSMLYLLRYPLYISVYLAFLGFLTLIYHIQKYRLNLKQQTERKIVELQIKAIKNQIDPHFTLNMLNAIGSLYATEGNRGKADYLFGKYAKLIRQTVVNSDNIIISLDEEMGFVTNYIELEQFRNNYSFGYTVDVDEDIDSQINIPRMLILIFVENSIKYGLRKRNDGGMLGIIIRKSGNKCRIIIEDNGPGMPDNIKSNEGTGKGLVILDELIELYSKLKGSRITYALENIKGSGRTIEGLRATIELTC